MNKKLLVIGDSYCASTNNSSWPYLLAKKLNADLDRTGEISASLFYAYRSLISSTHGYDYTLILVTNPGRIYYPDLPFFSNPFAASWAKNTHDKNLYNKAHASELYYKHLSNEMFDNFVHDILIEKIQKHLISKKYLIYPNFKTSRVSTDYFTMLDVTNKCFSKFFDHENFNFYKDVYQTYKETSNVINHSTIESQEI